MYAAPEKNQGRALMGGSLALQKIGDPHPMGSAVTEKNQEIASLGGSLALEIKMGTTCWGSVAVENIRDLPSKRGSLALRKILGSDTRVVPRYTRATRREAGTSFACNQASLCQPRPFSGCKGYGCCIFPNCICDMNIAVPVYLNLKFTPFSFHWF